MSDTPKYQTDLPSQQARDNSAPYYPQPEFRTNPPIGVPGSPPSTAHVLTTFDARPINGVDLNTFYTTVTSESVGSTTEQILRYVVPSGFVAIIRAMHLRAYISGDPGQPGFPLTDQYGAANFAAGVINLSVRVDGSPTQGLSNLPIPNLILGVVSLPCYFMGDENQAIDVILSLDPASVAIGAIHSAAINLHGNLLSRTGIELNLEPATQYPLPVRNG